MKTIIFVILLALYAIKAEQAPGDCDGNGQVDISDAVCIINYIFLGIEPPRLEWWERDTTSTLLVFDGRMYVMERHNIALWRQFVVTGSDTSTFEWIRIGESMTMDSSRILEVR